MVRMIGSGSTPLHRFRTGSRVRDLRTSRGERHDRPACRHSPANWAHNSVCPTRCSTRSPGRTSVGTVAAGPATWPATRSRSRRGSCSSPSSPRSRTASVASTRRSRSPQRPAGARSSTRSLVDTLVLDAAKVFGQIDDAGSWDTVIDAEPSLAIALTEQQCDDALLAISRFVDLKSPFTIGHSARRRRARGRGRATARPRR